MTFNLTAQIQRDIQLDCSTQQAFELLKDIPKISTLYPKLEKIEALGTNQWRWDLERMGAGGLTHQVTYAVVYSDNGSNKIAWKALPEQGNTKVSGEWEIKNSGGRCTLSFKSNNELELPYPRLMHKAIESMIQKELDDQINTFLERIKKHLEN